MNGKCFKIPAPFTDSTETESLKKADAEELYCGCVTAEVTKKWLLAFNALNRRGEGQGLEDYDEFKKAIKKARACGLPTEMRRAIEDLPRPQASSSSQPASRPEQSSQQATGRAKKKIQKRE